jgi:RNA polymerase sigma-70 factor (ECF subfamily)
MDKEKKSFIYDKRVRDFIIKLYDKYREGMLKLAFSKLNDWHEAEDAVEEAFINAAKNYEKIADSEEYEIKKYLVKTVINTSYKILDKNKRNDYGNMDTIEEYSPYVDSAEETALLCISYDELKSSVDELSPRYKLILNMKSIGYSNKEIAEELNVKSGTVRVMLLRIRSSLKKSKEGSRNEEGQK